ncbi:MAG: hypothetical protein ACJAYK_002403 [Crocinitomicaceae bacterium]|jgi:hypothetical protein
MPTLLLKLKNVPDDEHIEICELLEQNQISYYETNVGFWGIGMAAIWLRDPNQLNASHELLNEYMKNRQVAARHAYEEALQSGQVRTLLNTFQQQPLMFILYCLGLVVIVGLSTLPFLSMM